ncbi:hypothetical protein SO694_00004656 [Aureococcus anophagefferens]|uniref:Uncharacterized protein n=1 Tax=Aureococcus anophagefferens TaxID=44056 RepID=A0ABR1G8X4_AURAN
MLRAVIAAFLAATTSGDVAELCAAQASRAAPEKLAQEQQFNSPSRCRGWPLLRRLASDVVGAATVEADGAVAFELAPCGNNATFRRSLSVFLSFYSADVRDATLATAEPGSRALRVRWRPPLAGAYDVVARLHFYGDDCDGSPPVYLGGSERAARRREKCKTPLLQKSCDELARVPAAPRRIAAPAALAADAAADAPQCRDGATRDGGHWRRRPGAGPATGSPWDALVARSVHKADKKMAPWRFARPGCAYHYAAPGGDALRARSTARCSSSSATASCGASTRRPVEAKFARQANRARDAAEATRRGGAFAAADLLDLSNLTKARFDDATLDGVHYGQTAATMGATVLLNMLAARP